MPEWWSMCSGRGCKIPSNPQKSKNGRQKNTNKQKNKQIIHFDQIWEHDFKNYAKCVGQKVQNDTKMPKKTGSQRSVKYQQSEQFQLVKKKSQKKENAVGKETQRKTKKNCKKEKKYQNKKLKSNAQNVGDHCPQWMDGRAAQGVLQPLQGSPAGGFALHQRQAHVPCAVAQVAQHMGGQALMGTDFGGVQKTCFL